MRVLRGHGISTESLHDVFRATILAKITYCLPAWCGLCSASDRAKLDSFLNRCKRLSFCDNTVPTISDIFSNADDSLFKAILKNSYHVLYPYLPESHCHRHNKALIPKTLSVYRSRFEALPSIGPAFFAEQMVKRSNNSTENGHIYARGFAEDCYRLGCEL